MQILDLEFGLWDIEFFQSGSKNFLQIPDAKLLTANID